MGLLPTRAALGGLTKCFAEVLMMGEAVLVRPVAPLASRRIGDIPSRATRRAWREAGEDARTMGAVGSAPKLCGNLWSLIDVLRGLGSEISARGPGRRACIGRRG